MQVSQFTTEHISRSDRLQHWNDLTASFFPGMVIDAAEDLSANWRALSVGNTQLCVAKSQKSRVSRWMGNADIKATGRAIFHVQTKGMSNTIQGGENMLCSAGELAACHSDQPYEIEISNSNECLVIDCPDDVVSVQELRGQVVSVTDNIHVRLLLDFAQNMFRQNWADQETSEQEEMHLEAALNNLIRNCVSSAEFVPQTESRHSVPSSPKKIYELAITFVDRHISDSSMRTSLIARKLGVAEHLVQKSFARFGTTPTAYIHDRRLCAARDRLLDPKFDGRMTDLAYDLGFSDSAHFSRRFKARFKMTPSHYQRANMLDA